MITYLTDFRSILVVVAVSAGDFRMPRIIRTALLPVADFVVADIVHRFDVMLGVSSNEPRPILRVGGVVETSKVFLCDKEHKSIEIHSSRHDFIP